MNKRAFVFRNGKSVHRSRVVMSEHLGRPLNINEHVHHINGDVSDDRIENLEIMAPGEHVRHHQSGKKDDWIDQRTNQERQEWVMAMWGRNERKSI